MSDNSVSVNPDNKKVRVDNIQSETIIHAAVLSLELSETNLISHISFIAVITIVVKTRLPFTGLFIIFKNQVLNINQRNTHSQKMIIFVICTKKNEKSIRT